MPAQHATKLSLKDELIELVRADLEKLERAHRATVEGATHEQAKAENDKDTRALEQTYLARGQAMRIEELRDGLSAVKQMKSDEFDSEKPVAIGALVTALEEDRTVQFFIAPYGGGSRLSKGKIQVVTPQSPLGKALIGKRVGEACEILKSGTQRELELVKIV